MEADFSGWVTKAGLRCSDGRTIAPDAFKHQDTKQVPLVWQHNHSDPENVLGHVLLENRPEGVYGYGFFNKTAKAAHAHALVEHRDINMMSIWANQLIEKAKTVFHGAIREVSLVLSGANPGATIENVRVRHSDDPDDDELLDDEAIIFTGLTLEHSDGSKGTTDNKGDDVGDKKEEQNQKDVDLDFQAIVDSMSEEQQSVLQHMVSAALQHAAGDDGGDETVEDIYNSMTDKQKELCHFMVSEALASSDGGDSVQQDNLGTEDDDKKGDIVRHNVFEDDKDSKDVKTSTLSHDDMKSIVADAMKRNIRLSEAAEGYALAHGIEDIDVLFPDAKPLTDAPEIFGRRTEWVADLMVGLRKSPFSRIKTISADLTPAEARAKGYIKGNLKKEEFFRVSKRSTTPTTVYKKQKLDRDDMIDITDFDVVAWLKGEMRIMLDEEVARAVLVGDGRAGDDEDKISEDNIRPVASDHELYTTTITVNIDNANSSMREVSDAIALNRSELRGTGLPTLYTTETYIAKWMTQRDGVDRRLYKSLDEIASELRVAKIVAVEVLEEYEDIVAILFNPADYVVGADKGGNISMFDDFDIDYNQYKYLIETRLSGALVKLKSAMVVRKTAGTNVAVDPDPPTFADNEITIDDQTGVVYRNAATDAVMNAAGSPYTLAPGEELTVNATPAAGYYFESSEGDSWTYTGV